MPPPFAIIVAASGTTKTKNPSYLSFSDKYDRPDVLPAQGPPVIHILIILAVYYYFFSSGLIICYSDSI